MELLNSILILINVISFVSYGNSWVLTDVNYDQLRRLDSNSSSYDDVIEDEDLSDLKFSLIYPGTKWCGPGNIAEYYEDLGLETATDMCCRQHDNCADIMRGLETKQNLTNTAFYTRLSCNCDDTFRRCLRDSNNTVADQIGTIYFNALGTQCFREEYPVIGCNLLIGSWFNKKCLEYIYDTSGEKIIQWFDVPNY